MAEAILCGRREVQYIIFTCYWSCP